MLTHWWTEKMPKDVTFLHYAWSIRYWGGKLSLGEKEESKVQKQAHERSPYALYLQCVCVLLIGVENKLWGSASSGLWLLMTPASSCCCCYCYCRLLSSLERIILRVVVDNLQCFVVKLQVWKCNERHHIIYLLQNRLITYEKLFPKTSYSHLQIYIYF